MNSSKPVPNEAGTFSNCRKFFNCDHGKCTVKCCGSGLQFSYKHNMTCIPTNECKQTDCCCQLYSPCDNSCDSRSNFTSPRTQTTQTISTTMATSTTFSPTPTLTISPLAVASFVLNAVSFISILSLIFFIFHKFSDLFVTMTNNFKNLQFRLSQVSDDYGWISHIRIKCWLRSPEMAHEMMNFLKPQVSGYENVYSRDVSRCYQNPDSSSIDETSL